MKSLRVLVPEVPGLYAQLAAAAASESEVQLSRVAARPDELIEAARTEAPAAVVLDLRVAALAQPELIVALLRESRAAVVARLGPDPYPAPDVLLRGLAVGRIALVRGSAEPAVDLRDARALLAEIRTLAAGGQLAPSAPLRAGKGPALARPAVVGIAASTGGPPALAALLGALPADLPLPLLIAQHIAPGFAAGLAAQLGRQTPLSVSLASDGTQAQAGHVYLAPDGCDLEIDRWGRLRVPASGSLHCPCADQLFRSMAAAYGSSAAGVILTGMGSDGAQGLLEIARCGGRTFAQDEASSVVFGMPRAAAELGAVDRFVALDRLAPMLLDCVRRGP